MHNAMTVPVIAPEDASLKARLETLVEQFCLTVISSSDSQSFTQILAFDDNKLKLFDTQQPKMHGVCVDFASDALTYRRLHGGGQKEFIAKAVGVKANRKPSIIDCTAGLGRDAFLLASLGCRVTMIERSPVVAALLYDGLSRGTGNAEITDWLPQRLKLIYGKAHQILSTWKTEPPQVIYMDPMFPHRKKSAAVKKEMRVFQQLLGDDLDADEMLAPALSLASNRVVVKRPASAGYLDNHSPDTQVASKKHRFDMYFTHQD